VASFFLLLSVAVKIDRWSLELLWRDRPYVAFLILVIGLLCMFLYIQIDKWKLARLSQQIKGQESESKATNQDAFYKLTNRQKEVYNLIIAGRTNKEIMRELFIEASTLKTHINQIYRKLGIKSRKELKWFHDSNLPN